MKKDKNMVAACIAAVMSVLAGCSSTTSVVKTEARPVIVDWQGAAYGTDVPDWAKAALESDFAYLGAMPEFGGKVVKIASNRGNELDLLRAWVSADAADALSRGITQSITTNLGNTLSGNKDADSATVKLTKQAVGIFSSNVISGFEKNREFWIKQRNPNGTEEYEYLVLYAINEDALAFQIDRALGKISVETEAERNALDEIDRLVKESAMRANAF